MREDLVAGAAGRAVPEAGEAQRRHHGEGVRCPAQRVPTFDMCVLGGRGCCMRDRVLLDRQALPPHCLVCVGWLALPSSSA